MPGIEGDRRPTQKQIAEAAGVSRPSVHLALRGRSGISQEKREKVLAVARELGYPVIDKSSVIEDESTTQRQRRLTQADAAREIGVSVKTLGAAIKGSPGVSMERALSIREAARAMGYLPYKEFERPRLQVLAPSYPVDASLVQRMIDESRIQGYDDYILSIQRLEERLATKESLGGQADGIVLVGPRVDTQLLRQWINRSQLPIVGIDLDQRIGMQPNLIRIDVDHAGGIRDIMSYLLDLGHKPNKIAYIAGDRNSAASRIREDTYRMEMQKNGVSEHGLLIHTKLDEFISEDPTPQDGYKGGFAAGRILASYNPPTAIIADNDQLAFGARRAVVEAGLRIPEDVSLIGFGGSFEAEFASLTTVVVPKETIAVEAIGALTNALKDPLIASEGSRIEIPVRLKVQESSGAPRM